MAAEKKSQKTGTRGYSVHVKKVLWIEAVCVLAIWLLFITGLLLTLYLRTPSDASSMMMLLVIGSILLFALVPFLANWAYYGAVWKAWREGKEIIYRESEKGVQNSVLGNREVWIKN